MVDLYEGDKYLGFDPQSLAVNCDFNNVRFFLISVNEFVMEEITMFDYDALFLFFF